MAIRKDKASPLVKAVIIVVAISFVVTIIPLVVGQGGGTTQQPTSQGQGQSDTIAAKFQPQITSLRAALQNDPNNYNTLVTLGNTYYEWARELGQNSQSGANQPIWLAAADAYKRALAVKAGDPSVTTDMATSTFYSGDTSAAIAAIEPLVKANASFTNAHTNAAVFYSSAGRTADAIALLETFLRNNPKSPDAAAVREQLNKLKAQGSVNTSATPTTATP